MTRELVLEGISLTKEYVVGGTTIRALDNVNVRLTAGEIVTVLGPSGAGKSTLLYVLSGLERPTTGKVLLDGIDIYQLTERRLTELRSKVFGFVFQSYNLIGNMTAQENVEVALRIQGNREARSIARCMLEAVGLGARLRHTPGQMSGGEQQRVAIARALVKKPRVLFADEPTGNVDSRTGEGLIQLMVSMVREAGAACMLVTHNQAWVEVADRVLYLRDGRLEEN